MSNKIIIVQGGQFGSEAKGQIAGVICEREGVDIAVRTGATNAGHTYYAIDHSQVNDVLMSPIVPVKFQQLPVAAAIRGGPRLVLGAGSLIDPYILDAEVQLASRLTGEDVRKRLAIDYRAALHLPIHAKRSEESGRHVKMGATGKGSSEALVERIMGRGDPLYQLFGQSPFAHDYDVQDTECLLNSRFDEGAKIMLEGTQGQGLDLYLGPYPYTTHKQTGPGQWMLECGLSPSLPTDIVMVVRTYPIRVAGNSGPMRGEISWQVLARELNRRRREQFASPLIGEWAIREFEQSLILAANEFAVPSVSATLYQNAWADGDRVRYADALSNLNKRALEMLPTLTIRELKRVFEFTTVTKKLRRIGVLDRQQLRDSTRQIRPHRVAITFMNYAFPEHWYEIPFVHSPEMREYVHTILHECGSPSGVTYLGWGPESSHVVGIDIIGGNPGDIRR